MDGHNGVHPKAFEFYKCLEGMRFSGTYNGVQENPNYGTYRAVFVVDTKDPDNNHILDLFNQIRKKISKCHAKMWRGFSGQQDYDHNYDWDLWIWAPKSCALPDSYIDQALQLEITEVQFFDFNYTSKHDYEVGVNIVVDEYDTYRNLEAEYEDLQGYQFVGRYIGEKYGSADVLHSVFEVDPEVPFNYAICEQFDSIRAAWEEDGRRAHKSFTDAKDSHQGYNWNLWIWATEGSAPKSYSDSDCDSYSDWSNDGDQTYTITSAEIDDWVAFIEVE